MSKLKTATRYGRTFYGSTVSAARETAERAIAHAVANPTTVYVIAGSVLVLEPTLDPEGWAYTIVRPLAEDGHKLPSCYYSAPSRDAAELEARCALAQLTWPGGDESGVDPRLQRVIGPRDPDGAATNRVRRTLRFQIEYQRLVDSGHTPEDARERALAKSWED